MLCPSDPIPDQVFLHNFSILGSYGYNEGLGNLTSDLGRTTYDMKPMMKIGSGGPLATYTPVWADNYMYAYINQQSKGGSYTLSWETAASVGAYGAHGDGRNTVFLDGHVERATVAYGYPNAVWPGNTPYLWETDDLANCRVND